MARPGMTIAALEQLLASRQNDLGKLLKKRQAVEQELAALDKQIGRIGGGSGLGRKTGGTRARNEQSLTEAIDTVLKAAGKPMGVGEILEGVEATGYRSSSANFRGIINQTLIKERKLFTQTGRGMYQAKK